jgi:hypothetical protein
MTHGQLKQVFALKKARFLLLRPSHAWSRNKTRVYCTGGSLRNDIDGPVLDLGSAEIRGVSPVFGPPPTFGLLTVDGFCIPPGLRPVVAATRPLSGLFMLPGIADAGADLPAPDATEGVPLGL